MKKRINLLSPEVITSVASGNYLKFPILRGPLLLKALALSLVILAAVTVYQQTIFTVYKQKVAQANKKYSNLQAELKQNKDVLARMQVDKSNYTRKKKELEDKFVVLVNITKSDVEQSSVLAELAGLVPADMWINKIKMDREKIKLTGKTTNNSVVSDFMVKMDKSPYFENTTFTYTEKTKFGEQKVIEFEIVSQRKNAGVVEEKKE